MLKLIPFIVFLISCGLAQAAETKTRELDTVASSKNTPICIADPQQIKAITDGLKLTKSKKYQAYIDVFSSYGISTKEILARLVYAETLAANCSEQNAQIIPLIGSVIANRVKRRPEEKILSEVVFEPYQFASSLHNYDESQMKQFLCPSKSSLWSQVEGQMGAVLAQPQLPADATNYYLFKHAPDRLEVPEWTKKLIPVDKLVNGGDITALKSCVTVYKGAGSWK